MLGIKKSDSLIVVMKPPNKGVPTPAEAVEQSGLTKGNPMSQNIVWTQIQEAMTQATHWVRLVEPSVLPRRHNLR